MSRRKGDGAPPSRRDSLEILHRQKLETLAKQNPTEPQIQEDLGMLLAEAGDYEKASKLLERALEYGIPSVSLLSTRGHVVYVLQDYAEAQSLLQRAVNLALTQGRKVRLDTYARLARACVLVGDLVSARSGCEEALQRVSPSYYAPKRARANGERILSSSRSKSASKQEANASKPRGDSYGGVGDLHMVCASVAMHMFDANGALEHLQRAFELVRNRGRCGPFRSEHLWALVSRAYAMMGRSTLAHRAISMSRVRRPEDLWLDLADTLLRQEDFLGALGAADQGLVHCPFSGPLLETKCTALRALKGAAEVLSGLEVELSEATALLEGVAKIEPASTRSMRLPQRRRGGPSVACAAFSRAEFELDVGEAASPRFAHTIALAESTSEDSQESRVSNESRPRPGTIESSVHSGPSPQRAVRTKRSNDRDRRACSTRNNDHHNFAGGSNRLVSTPNLAGEVDDEDTRESGRDLLEKEPSAAKLARKKSRRIKRLARREQERSIMRLHSTRSIAAFMPFGQVDQDEDTGTPKEDRAVRLQRMRTQRATMARLATQKSSRLQLTEQHDSMSSMDWTAPRTDAILAPPQMVRPQSSRLRFKKPPLVHQQSWPPRDNDAPTARPRSAPRSTRFGNSRETSTASKVRLARMNTRLTKESSISSLHLDDRAPTLTPLETHPEQGSNAGEGSGEESEVIVSDEEAEEALRPRSSRGKEALSVVQRLDLASLVIEPKPPAFGPAKAAQPTQIGPLSLARPGSTPDDEAQIVEEYSVSVFELEEDAASGTFAAFDGIDENKATSPVEIGSEVSSVETVSENHDDADSSSEAAPSEDADNQSETVLSEAAQSVREDDSEAEDGSSRSARGKPDLSNEVDTGSTEADPSSSLQPIHEAGSSSLSEPTPKQEFEVKTLDDVQAVSKVDPVSSVRALLSLIETEDENERVKRSYTGVSAQHSLASRPVSRPKPETVLEEETMDGQSAEGPSAQSVNPVEAAEALLSLIANESSDDEDFEQDLSDSDILL